MAASLVGGAFLNSTLNVLFERLASKEFINFFRGRNREASLLKKLKVKLLGLSKVLNDAENKQFTDQNVKAWLDELRGAVYDAEDLVDEIAYAALASKVEAEYQSGPNLQAQSLISSFTKLFDDGIESKLERMIERLQDFTEEINELGLTQVAGPNWPQTRRATTSLVDESSVYGRENDRVEIMKLLLSDGESSQGIDVIPIVGMGGMGKTTLAQLLYNDGRLESEGHFVKKAWVCVSDVFDVLSITRTIVEKVTGGAGDAKDLDSLQVKLKESLRGEKFLIVLDDVWNENYDDWNFLMTPFKSGACGSKIIVTTRNDGVANTMQTGVPIHRLHELPEEHCWELFSQHAFEKGDRNAHPDLVRIGKEIVKKCEGLPLAAKTLGGLLRSYREVQDWKNILESALWELPEGKSNILPVLRLSYHYLPSHLKRCFALCSIFIKDYRFNREELVSIWMAEGLLVKTKKNKTLAEEGYECFQELLSRSFFQRSNADDSSFVMHDLVHDLAEYVMGDFCNRLDSRDDDMSQCISEKVRHFSCSIHGVDGVDFFKVIEDAKCLRTFRLMRINGREQLSKKVLDNIISRMPSLRMLSLPNYRMPMYGITELPDSIGNLIHLRFLDLSNIQITKLPDSICTLYNLETLLLSGAYELKEMPKNINRLKRLQRLTHFVVGKSSGSGINGLKELDSLRGAIEIRGLENVVSGNDASEAKLKEKKQLEKLSLKWGGSAEDSQKERDVLENLEPHTNLKHLEIINYGGTTFPTWLGNQSFRNMVSLRLYRCMNCFSLPPLGQMSSLQELELSFCPEIQFFPGGGLPSKLATIEIFYCKKLVGGLRDWGLQTLPSLTCFALEGESEDVLESFPEEGLLPPTLISLYLGEMPNLKSLNEKGLQPLVSLRRMVIRECPKLQSLPAERLPDSLLVLSIFNCPLLKSRCRREEGEDWHKIAHIPHINHLENVYNERINRDPLALFFSDFWIEILD